MPRITKSMDASARQFLSSLGGQPAAPGSREHAQLVFNQAFEAYKLARRDRPQQGFQPHAYSGDAAIASSQELMHRRTRDLVRNTGQGKRIKRMLVNLVVGTGMHTFAWPFLPSELLETVTELESLQAGELGPRLQYALESDDLFEEYFSDKKQFDIEGRLSGPEFYRMLLGESITVGNGLMVRVFRRDFDPDKHLVPVAWQLFEREQLDQSQDRPASTGRNKIVGGMEFNRDNQVVAYRLFLDHPHDFFGVSGSAQQNHQTGTKSVRVSAERVIDLALFDRPSSSSGVSWMDASGQGMWDKGSYCDSEIRAAAVDSVFVLAAHLVGGEKYGEFVEGFGDGLASDDDFGNREFKVGHSPVAQVLGTEEKIEMHRPARPNRDAPTFLKYLDRDIAGSVDLSYYSLTGDYESTNFTSTRGAKLDEDLSIRPIQQWFGRTVALPVRQTFNSIAAASGRFASVRPAEFHRSARTYQRFDVIGQGRDLLDPFKEGEARTARLRTSMGTFKEECARQGKHWIRELMQQAIEQRVFKLFGVSPDFTKSGSGAPAN